MITANSFKLELRIGFTWISEYCISHHPHQSFLFKVHTSFAITMALEGFYPKNLAGYTIDYFNSYDQALPLISFVISMVTSSFGMTKFFLHGPVQLLPKNYPINGLISLPFLCTLLINCMFAVRMICIENAFFSSYRYHQYRRNGRHSTETTIDPIIPPEFRLLVFFAPCFISFVINAIRLLATCVHGTNQIRKYPQILIASCFTPFMFEGCNENSTRIWRLGTILNAFFIGCLPQIILLFLDYHRGVVNWNFIGISEGDAKIYENNDALFKSRFGNSIFALTTGVLFLFLIIFTFLTDMIFENNSIFSKCFSILCSPCPAVSKHLQKSSSITENNDESNFAHVRSTKSAKHSKVSLIKLHSYSKCKNVYGVEKSKLEQGTISNEVNFN